MFLIGRRATTCALTDLYSREECIEPLRNEFQGHIFDEFKASADGLPLSTVSLRNLHESVHSKVVSLTILMQCLRLLRLT
jgi:hypothetical protein